MASSFFVSNRNYSPRYSQTEWNHAYFDMENIYFVTLAKETKSPFAPKSDEVKIKKDDKAPKNGDKEEKDSAKKEEKDATKEAGEKEEKKVVVKVDPEGVGAAGLAVLPIAASNYGHLTSVGDKLYYTRHGTKDEKTRIFLYDLDKQKETDLGEFSGFEISADSKKMLVSGDGSFAIIDLPTAKIDAKEKLNLGDLKMTLDRRAEWNQIYRESWRQMRTSSTRRICTGWTGRKSVRSTNRFWRIVNHRADLNYIIGEMIGELNVGHTYVGGGDYPKAERIATGLLRWRRDRARSGFGLLSHQGNPPRPKLGQSLRSPLTEIGVDVREGDYILPWTANRPTKSGPSTRPSPTRLANR